MARPAVSLARRQPGQAQVLVAGAVAANLASQVNHITLLRDSDGDGDVDLKTLYIGGLNKPTGMVLVGDALYVANTDALLRFVDLRTTDKTPQEDPAEPDQALTQAYLRLSEIAEHNKDLAAARQWLERIDNPDQMLSVQMRRASLLARQGQLAQARTLIQKLPARTPEDARMKISAEVQILRDHKQFQAAYDVLAQALADNPKDLDFQYDQAMMAEKLGRLDEMERLLRWASWVLTLPVILFSCGPFFRAAWRDIVRRRVPLVAELPAAQQLRLKQHVQVLLAEVPFIGCAGLVIDDEVRVRDEEPSLSFTPRLPNRESGMPYPIGRVVASGVAGVRARREKGDGAPVQIEAPCSAASCAPSISNACCAARLGRARCTSRCTTCVPGRRRLRGLRPSAIRPTCQQAKPLWSICLWMTLAARQAHR